MPGKTLFDSGGLQEEWQTLLGIPVDVRTSKDLPPKFRDASLHPERSSLPHMGEMLRDQIQAFMGEAIEIETQAEMVQRHQQSL